MWKWTKAAMATAALATAAGEADAQTRRYYLRQSLATSSTVAAQTYTYTAAYGAYGACSGGTKTAAIATCTRSDGAVVATSSCSPETKSSECSFACDVVYRFQTYSGGGTRKPLGSSFNFATTQSYCSAGADLGSGVCQILSVGGAFHGYYIVGATVTTSNDGAYFAGACQSK